MQSFLGDAGKGGNALNKVSQREGVDNSLFRDRFNPQAGGSSSQQSFRPSPHAAQQAHPPQPFNLSHLSAALADPTVSNAPPGHFEASWGARPASGPVLQQPMRSGPGFASEYQSRPQGSGWADSFQPQTQSKGKGRAQEPVHSPNGYAGEEYGAGSGGYSQSGMGMGGMGMGGMGMGMGMGMGGYQPSFQPMYSGYHNSQYQPPPQQQLPQSALSTEKSMEDAFEAAMSDWKAMGDEHKQQELSKEEVKVDEKQDQAEEVEDRGEAKGELEKVWESLTSDETRQDKLAQWEKDFSQFTNDDEQDEELLRTLNESLAHPDVGQAGLDEQMRVEEGFMREESPTFETLNYDLDQRQKSRAYEFTLPNRLDSMDAQDAWTQANHLLNSGGSLTDATLMLESYLRRGVDATAEDPARQLEAWSLLGRVHAMNEKEEKALLAFEEGRQAIRGTENSAVIGEMLTNLAISHVNESSDLEALQVLHQFLAIVHPKHAGARPTRESVEKRGDPWASHQDVTDMFLDLARQQYSDKGIVDPDVQVGLGTLYYMMGEYGEATDCWTAALGERPNDYLLWNRLGATLANGGSPEEAVDAYRRALELKPLFTRATFNLGVACLNIGVHKEAAEHFLAALSLHARDAEKEQRDSTPIWLTLRRALIAMDMLELSGKARPGADLNMFRQAGFEF